MNHSEDRRAIDYINGRLLELTYEMDVCVSIRGKARLEREASALLTAKNTLVSRIPIFADDTRVCFEVGHRRCPCCDTPTKIGAAFCGVCGQALKWEEANG